jgi:DNA-binding CsgD family transcriptional regulator
MLRAVGTVRYVGRDAQLGLLRGLVAGAAGGRGGVALVEGEPGIGKSSLVSLALAEAQALGCVVLGAAGDELSQRFPLRVMLAALRVESRSSDPRRAEVASLMGGGSTAGLAGGDPVAAASEGLLGLVERLCAQRPHVLVVDDLHWVDEASLLVWRRLARVAEQVPLLLVGVCRPVPDREPVQSLRRDVVARRGHLVVLGPLAEAEVAELVAGLVRGVPGVALRREVGRASGNPLWVREVVDALVRDGVVRVEDGVAEVSGEVSGELGSLSAAVDRRLGSLPSAITELLRVAALLGTEFSVSDVACVLGRPAVDLVGVIKDALLAGVVVEAGPRLTFRHPLIRQALYDGVPPAVRAGLHRHAARALVQAGASADTVTEQLMAAGGRLDEWSVDWLQRAAPALVGRSLEVAAELLARGVEAVPDTDPRGEALRSLLAEVLQSASRWAEAEKQARLVMAGTGDADRAAKMRDLLALMLMGTGRATEGLDVLAEGLGDPRISDSWRARLLGQRAMLSAFGLGDLDAAAAPAGEARTLGERAGDRYAVGRALHAFATIDGRRGDLVASARRIDQALAAVGEDPECDLLRVTLLANRVSTLQQLDESASAARTLSELRTLAERTRPGVLNSLHMLTADHDFWTGRWDDALAELDAVTGNPASYQVLWPAGIAALIAGHRDDRAAAARHLRAGADVRVATAMDRLAYGYLASAEALAAERDGRVGDAVSALSYLCQPEVTLVGGLHRWLPALVRLALAADERGTAQAAAQLAEGALGSHPNPAVGAVVQRCRGLLDADPAPVLAAAGHYRTASHPGELAQTLEDAAVLLAARGDEVAARAAFAEAARHYADLGALWDMRRADTRLRPYGIRRGVRGPRRRPSRGWEALSPTELTVARLVAEGRSNPDIAAELLLSRRTVQSHVSHILTKLDVRSRVEIARQVAERARPA